MKNRAQIVVDQAGRILRCNGAWDRMMRARRLRHLTGSQIAGEPFRSFIPTSTRRQLADGIVQSIRDQPQTVQLDCLAPDSGERLLLIVGPGPSESGCQSITIEISRVDTMNVCRDSEDIGMINMCSRCRRIQVQEELLDVIEAVQSLHLLCLDPPPPISHGLCADCFKPSSGEPDA